MEAREPTGANGPTKALYPIKYLDSKWRMLTKGGVVVGVGGLRDLRLGSEALGRAGVVVFMTSNPPMPTVLLYKPNTLN